MKGAVGVFLLFLLPYTFSFSQKTVSVSEELHFAQYLIDNNQYRDAIFILKKQLEGEQKISDAQLDSINYFIGWSYYSLKLLDSSSFYFDNVKEDPFYYKAAFYRSFDLAYQKKISEAKIALEKIPVGKDSSFVKLQNLEFAGIALLERDYPAFETRSKNFSYNYFALSSEEKKLGDHCKQLKKVKNKSPLLAGMMSAIVPGTGKMYAGYKGQGIAAMVTVGILGIATAESYYRLGYKSPHFITFGSLFTIFYVGNIWGSAVSVKLSKEHQLREIDDAILFDMHIPLRRIFN